jgi:VIT1/CCC1 family predicted Fe2+/Mn2+ transporter
MFMRDLTGKSRSSSSQELQRSHTKEAIAARLKLGPKHSYLKDFIYGAVDGTVTTFAVVSGVAGADLSNNIVIILGFANLLADGFSMAVSNYLGTRAEQEVRLKAEAQEKQHIDLVPEGEKEEVRQIFSAKGFQGEDLEKIVAVITSDSKLWLSTMMQEELGLARETASPFKAASTTFMAFLVIGFFPLISFVFFSRNLELNPFLLSSVITGCAFFIIGALKSPFVEKKWYKSGLETLFVGGCAALLAYGVGLLLKNIS